MARIFAKAPFSAALYRAPIAHASSRSLSCSTRACAREYAPCRLRAAASLISSCISAQFKCEINLGSCMHAHVFSRTFAPLYFLPVAFNRLGHLSFRKQRRVMANRLVLLVALQRASTPAPIRDIQFSTFMPLIYPSTCSHVSTSQKKSVMPITRRFPFRCSFRTDNALSSRERPFVSSTIVALTTEYTRHRPEVSSR